MLHRTRARASLRRSQSTKPLSLGPDAAPSSPSSSSSSYSVAVRTRALELVKLEQDARALASSWAEANRQVAPAISQDTALSRRTPSHGGCACNNAAVPCSCQNTDCRRRCRSRSRSPPRRCREPCQPFSAYALRGVLPRPVSPIFAVPSCAPLILPMPFGFVGSPVLMAPPLYRNGFCDC